MQQITGSSATVVRAGTRRPLPDASLRNSIIMTITGEIQLYINHPTFGPRVAQTDLGHINQNTSRGAQSDLGHMNQVT